MLTVLLTVFASCFDPNVLLSSLVLLNMPVLFLPMQSCSDRMPARLVDVDPKTGPRPASLIREPAVPASPAGRATFCRLPDPVPGRPVTPR